MNINCLNEDSTKKAAKILRNKLSDKFRIGTESISKPKIEVVGIDNFENVNNEELENDINTRNFKDCDGKCVVLSTYKNSRNNTITAIIEVPSEIYEIIRESCNNKIYVRYQNCKIYGLRGSDIPTIIFHHKNLLEDTNVIAQKKKKPW